MSRRRRKGGYYPDLLPQKSPTRQLRANGSLHVTADCFLAWRRVHTPQSQTQGQTVLPHPVSRCVRRWLCVGGWGGGVLPPSFYTVVVWQTNHLHLFHFSSYPCFFMYGFFYWWLVRNNTSCLFLLPFRLLLLPPLLSSQNLTVVPPPKNPCLPSPTLLHSSAFALSPSSPSIPLVSFLSQLNLSFSHPISTWYYSSG